MRQPPQTCLAVMLTTFALGLLAGCSSEPADTCAGLDRTLIAAIVETEDFTTSETGELPRQGGSPEDSAYRCTVSVDDGDRLKISAGTVAAISELDESNPDFYRYGAGRGYVTAKQATLGCGSVMQGVQGTEVGDNAIDASRGAMVAVLIDLADQTGCRDVKPPLATP